MNPFSKPVFELIRARSSVRTFRDKDLEPRVRHGIDELLKAPALVPGAAVRFAMIDTAAPEGGAKLGTYGVIRGARQFVASAVPKNDGAALLELGFRLEKAVLYAASEGLGSVWLGGTFSHGNFAKAVRLAEGELLPIVMPFGYPAEKRLFEKLMRKTAGSGHRKGWEELFFDGSLKPLGETAAGGFQTVLEAVRLAPSAMNAQPWRIVAGEDGSFAFFMASKPPQNGFDMHRIDMGIAMCHFALTAEEAGHPGAFDLKRPEDAEDRGGWQWVGVWRPKQ